MNSNTIELLLRQHGNEKGTREVLFKLGEEMQDMKRGMVELAQLVDKMSSVMLMQEQVMGNMKDKYDAMDDDPRSTRTMLDAKDD